MFAGVAEFLHVFDRVQAGHPVGDVWVEIELFAFFVDRDAFENDVFGVVGLQRARHENRIEDPVFLDAVFDEADADVEVAGHFDGAAEGDFTVALAEVEVAHGKAAVFHVNREVDFGSASEVFDVAVAAVFAGRDGAGAFGCGGVSGGTGHAAHVRGVRVRKRREGGDAAGFGVVEFFFALVPALKQFFGGETADEAGVHDAGELDVRDVARGGVDAVEIPASFASVGIMLGEKSATVCFGEEAGESPVGFFEGADVKDVDDHKVPWLRALDADGAAEVVDFGEIDHFDVFGVIVVFDLATGPVNALDAEFVARFDVGNHWNIRMPAVVEIIQGFRWGIEIDFNQCFHVVLDCGVGLRDGFEIKRRAWL